MSRFAGCFNRDGANDIGFWGPQCLSKQTCRQMKYGATKPANMQLTRHQRTAEAINKVAGTVRPLLVAQGVPLKGPVPTTRARYGP